jgi:ATP-dependent Clp protease ATP-binding subunit ClpA
VFEHFAPEARTVITSSVEEARLRGDRRVGTEHLLLAVLGAPASTGAGTLGSGTLGVGVSAARTALAALDREALAVVGIDAEGLDRPPVPVSSKRTPFTSGARAVIAGAAAESRRAGARRISPDHLLVALLKREGPDPAADLLAYLGVDREAAVRRVRESEG